MNAKSEDRDGGFATSAPWRASVLTRPWRLLKYGRARSAAPKRTRPPFSSRAKGGFRGRRRRARLFGGCGAGGDGVAAGGAATVSAAQAGGFYRADAGMIGQVKAFSPRRRRAARRAGGGASGSAASSRQAAEAPGQLACASRPPPLPRPPRRRRPWPLSKASLALRFFARHSANRSTQAPLNERGRTSRRATREPRPLSSRRRFEPPNAANNK